MKGSEHSPTPFEQPIVPAPSEAIMSKQDAEKQRKKEQIEEQLRRNKEIRDQWKNADKH